MLKIVATLFFPGDPEVLMAPEYEAKVEGFPGDEHPFGMGSTPDRAIADLKDNFCPCDCQPDSACMAAEECQRKWDDA